ncbi:MAG: tyrosine-type recombinase/integrase [Haloechinothrix sp.]
MSLWPGVPDPAALLTEIAEWLRGYGNRGTRRTYAEGLGLPVSPADLGEWLEAPSTTAAWAAALGQYAAALDLTESMAGERQATRIRQPPPAARGRLRQLHWFRWCVVTGTDPLAAGSADVKAWLDALDDAGAAVATRDRLLGTLKALYGYLADVGLTTGNPAALNRRRLGLSATGRASSTITLTTEQVAMMYQVAGRSRGGVSPLAALRAQAIVAVLTLGLRVSELCALDRADLHVTRGRRALRVTGKGGKPRIVYLSAPAEGALTAYLRARDSATGTRASVVRARRAGAPEASVPLLANLAGGRSTRQGVWQLLRRIARAAGGPLADVAERMHPHALRHFYVTTAVEAGAQLVHVQADVGHTSIDTTEQVYNAAARDPSRSAVDLVADAILRSGRDAAAQ